ncbi:unnamed protein product [Arctia plantaginis]|uniref:RNA-directed DNA polymerase n=1 Tax=Arctia plantaginis TaxID=874455 RepID=A0A8S1AJP1_ARCPL|nr:unnamed protein product [Arctia plantaginis]
MRIGQALLRDAGIVPVSVVAVAYVNDEANMNVWTEAAVLRDGEVSQDAARGDVEAVVLETLGMLLRIGFVAVTFGFVGKAVVSRNVRAEADVDVTALHEAYRVTAEGTVILLARSIALGDLHGTVRYMVMLKINGNCLTGFVDLGSQCTLMRCSDAQRLGISWETHDRLPVMRGIGNSIVVPLGVTTVNIEIQNIEEQVEVFIVSDEVIKYAVLIGHSFTEKPNIIITKTSEGLIFEKDTVRKVGLMLSDDIKLNPLKMCIAQVTCTNTYSGPIYVHGSLRGEPNHEFYLLPGEYQISKGQGSLLIQNVSKELIYLEKGTLLTRIRPVEHVMSINALNVENYESATLINCDQSLTAGEFEQLRCLLKQYQGCFSSGLKDLGFTNIVEMVIELEDSRPVVYRPYRLSYSERDLVRSMVQEMIESGIICESKSPYASPILLVKKKTGEKRLCVDYRALNNKTKRERYPLPLIDDQLDRLAGHSLFITLDCASGYYQIPIAEESQDKTAFVTPDGQYQFRRMPFGLANAPSVFQRAINKILPKSKVDFALIFMDDILIPAKSFREGMTRLEQVLKLLLEAGLTLKMSKCYFFYKEIDFLGFEVNGSGIKPGKLKTAAISNFPEPQNVHDIRRFIGLASFFRRFVKDFALIARPLTDLLRSNFEWKWESSHKHAFELLKQKLVERPLLALYDVTLETELHTDACKSGVAGILMQKQVDGSRRPVAYYSRKTTGDEQKLHSFELETLAVIASLKRFRVYLLGIKFKIITDCNALRTTLTKRDLIPRISRWWIQLQEYDCEIEYRAGSRMAHVDALSRAPVADPLPGDEDCQALDVLNIELKDWISTVQGNDDEIKRIREILQDPETKRVVDICKNYLLKGGYVYKILENDIRWVVPRAMRWQVLKMNHDDVGHFGFDKTLNRLRSVLWFPKMRRFTKKYVSACIECAHHKTPGGRKEGMLHPIPKLEVPFHTLHADHLGPFVRSRRGNTYVLAVIDSFTKFINIRPVRDTKSTTAIRVLKEHFSLFGTPSRLITDRGTCFTSGKFKTFINTSGIKHILNAVATPRANGQVERFNRTILDALGTKCHGKNDNLWDDYVGDIQLGLNTTVNKTTGKTPSELLFGCRLVSTSENILNDVVVEVTDRITGENLDKIREETKNRIEDQQRNAGCERSVPRHRWSQITAARSHE